MHASLPWHRQNFTALFISLSISVSLLAGSQHASNSVIVGANCIPAPGPDSKNMSVVEHTPLVALSRQVEPVNKRVNDDAWENISFILVAAATFQELRS
jgi:hypothetical protein